MRSLKTTSWERKFSWRQITSLLSHCWERRIRIVCHFRFFAFTWNSWDSATLSATFQERNSTPLMHYHMPHYPHPEILGLSASSDLLTSLCQPCRAAQTACKSTVLHSPLTQTTPNSYTSAGQDGEAQTASGQEHATVLVSMRKVNSTWGPSLRSTNCCPSKLAIGDPAEDSQWTLRNLQVFTASHFLSLVARCQTATWGPHLQLSRMLEGSTGTHTTLHLYTPPTASMAEGAFRPFRVRW